MKSNSTPKPAYRIKLNDVPEEGREYTFNRNTSELKNLFDLKV